MTASVPPRGKIVQTTALVLCMLLATLVQGAVGGAAATVRPKICLVLSGGGARGAAHVGVLKVLEEYRVPIDCVVGTSMGSLVGAAYATGMTLPEMDDIIDGISTELLFKEKPPREELAMRRKEDDNSILFSPEIGVSHGVRVGMGLVSGVQLETVLRRLTKAKGYFQFDELPIPYRAVATDLVTGKAVVFSEGDIAQVMRASMAVPGAVAPAVYNDMLLVDGMLTSNLPVQTARTLGADIIIAVNVGTPLLKREQINGIFGVSGQMLSILTEQNVQQSIATLTQDDILIDAAAELGDYTTGDFDNLAKIAPLGEVAARKYAARLGALSLPPPQYAALRERQQARPEPANPPIDEIRFVNLHRVNPIAVQAVMDTEAGTPVDQKVLDADMRRIYGTGDFEHVNYRYLEEPGRRVLAVEAVEKAWGPDYLRFGLGLSSDFTGDAFFNLLASYRRTWLNTLGAEWRNDVQFGRTSSLTTEFYQPLDARNYFFVAPRASVERRSVPLYEGDERVASYDLTTNLLGVDVGSQFYRYGELRIGMVFGRLKASLDTGPQVLAPEDSRIDQGAYVLRLVFDQLDNVSFPRAGWRGGARIYDASADLGAEDAYTKWDIDGSLALSYGEHTFNLGLKAGDTIGGNALPRYDQFQWGGFLQQSGYVTGQLVGQNLRFGRVMYYHRIMKGTLFDGAYGGFSLEAGRVGDPLVRGNDDGWLRSGSLFVGIDTPIGPAYLGYGHAAGGDDAYYFYLGKPY